MTTFNYLRVGLKMYINSYQFNEVVFFYRYWIDNYVLHHHLCLYFMGVRVGGVTYTCVHYCIVFTLINQPPVCPCYYITRYYRVLAYLDYDK